MSIRVIAGHKTLEWSYFISDVWQHTDGGQAPTVTLQTWHNVQRLVLQFSGSLVAVGVPMQVSTPQSLLMAKSSHCDASIAILAVMGTSDSWLGRGETEEIRRGYGNCMTESDSSAVTSRWLATVTEWVCTAAFYSEFCIVCVRRSNVIELKHKKINELKENNFPCWAVFSC